MKFFNRIAKMIEMTDFFNSTQMLRYENQNQYRTLTGGVLSLGIIITIIIGFASMIIDTLNLTSITSAQNIITRSNPSSTTFTTSPKENFMFGIQIWRQNLSSPIRYFDIIPQIYVQSSGINSPVDIQLVPCTKEHWSSIPSIANNVDKLGVSGWLCPQIGAQFQVLGKYTSEYYKQLVFTVQSCKNDTDPSRPCASPQEIDQLFKQNEDSFYFTFYYINTIINPEQPQYKSYYLEDTAYVIFGQHMGIESYIYFSDFDVTSDNSIWPFSDLVEDVGFTTRSLPSSHPYSITHLDQATYVRFAVAKSPTSIVYNRQVQKISTVFSFMGGLIGALMAGLFIINSYTSFAFEISIAFQVFKKKEQQNINQQQENNGNEHYGIVNFIHFIQYHWYIVKKFFNRICKDQNIQHLYQCRKQILRQLDIKSLIKRIIFLQYSMTFIFSDYQLEGLQLHKPTDPLEVKAVRKKIQNIDLAELESNISIKSKEKELIDILEPRDAFNLGVFLSSSKVANLHTQPTSAEINNNKTMESGRDCKDLIIQNISESNDNEQQERKQQAEIKKRFDIQKKKQTRIKSLMKSAKQGNQLSKRIWESIRQIQLSNLQNQ